MRSTSSSFHNATSPSGGGRPVRALITTRIGDWVTARCSEGDRHGVEQVGVVDGQDERPLAARPGLQTGQGEVQQVVGVVGVVAAVEHVGERAERDLAGRLGRPHPLDGRAVGLECGDRLGDEARLPDACLPEQHRPTSPAVEGKEAGHQLELCVSSHEWPLCDHGRERTGMFGNT